jgi:hypothetical protein
MRAHTLLWTCVGALQQLLLLLCSSAGERSPFPPDGELARTSHERPLTVLLHWVTVLDACQDHDDAPLHLFHALGSHMYRSCPMHA